MERRVAGGRHSVGGVRSTSAISTLDTYTSTTQFRSDLNAKGGHLADVTAVEVASHKVQGQDTAEAKSGMGAGELTLPPTAVM